MKFEEEIEIKATPEAVFSLYEDVLNWSAWDPEVKTSSISGQFTSGASGKLKPKSGPESKIVIESVIPNKSFLAKSNLPLCKMSFDHEILPIKNGVKVVHRVIFTGLLSPLFGRLIGTQIKNGLPNTMQGLKHAAETKS